MQDTLPVVLRGGDVFGAGIPYISLLRTKALDVLVSASSRRLLRPVTLTAMVSRETGDRWAERHAGGMDDVVDITEIVTGLVISVGK